MNLKAMTMGILIAVTGIQAQATLHCELSQIEDSRSSSRIVHFGEFLGTNYLILNADGAFTQVNGSFEKNEYKGAKIFAAFVSNSEIKIARMKVVPTGLDVSVMAIGDKSAPVSLISDHAKLVCGEK